MKNAILIVGGFIFGLLVAAGLSTTTNLFSDASQSGTEILEQVDTMLAQPRFDNKENCDKIVAKTAEMLPLLPDGSQAQLVIKYINESLKAKSARLAPTPVQAPVAQPVAEVEAAPTAEQIQEEAAEEVVHNTAPTSNNYFGGLQKPTLRGAAPEQEVDEETAKKIEGWSIGRQDIPEKTERVRRSYMTPEFKYVIDGKTYDKNCVQVETLDLCMELKNHDQAQLNNCRTQSIGGNCLEIIEKRGQSGLDYYEIQYNDSMR